jgi:hypothetical protein
MNRQPSKFVDLLTGVYRRLLWLYPAQYREEYGWLQVQLFRDKAYDTYSRCGIAGVALYWIKALADLSVSVMRERNDRELMPSDEALVGFHPYLLLASGILLVAASISQLQPDDHWQFYGIYAVSMIGFPIAIVTLVAGLYGLRAWFCRQAGLLGQLGIGMSIFGGGAAPFFMFMLPIGELIWGIMILGFVMLFCGIALIGFDMLMNDYLPVWIGVLMIVSGITPLIAVPVEPEHYGPRYVSFAGILIVGICWILIGNFLRHRAIAAAEWQQPSTE